MKAAPAQFRDADDFSEGYGTVTSGGKWGDVNRKGSLVIKPAFDDAALREVSIRKSVDRGLVGTSPSPS